jgi:hypothetical protein
MQAVAYKVQEQNVFATSEKKFSDLVARLQMPEVLTLEHSAVEQLVKQEGFEVLRQLVQDHLDLRAHTERDVRDDGPVVGNDGGERTHKRRSARSLETIFGEVTVTRAAYNGRGLSSRHPLDAELNLPMDKYSHGTRREVALEVAKNSYDDTVETLDRTIGAHVPKRQAEELAVRAARDFEEFYRGREEAAEAEQAEAGEVLVLSVDGKGVSMRWDSLREATRKAAAKRTPKLGTRRSKGEKRHTRRMATVAAVHTIEPYERQPEDIVKALRDEAETEHESNANARPTRPRPENKRVWASVENEPAEVIADMFSEALRRDPGLNKQWVALVDGNETQLELLHEQAENKGIVLTVILDLMHVLGYLWKAAWVFNEEGSPEAEDWVKERLLRILQGHSSDVAAGIRRSATRRGLSKEDRKAADKCADYLLKYRDYLHYNQFLAAGLPIATGVIEGACRHLVKDRMDITGARWGLEGAEAVLRLRSLYASGDFDEYWQFHLEQEKLVNHVMSYAGEPPSTRPIPFTSRHERAYLRVVR